MILVFSFFVFVCSGPCSHLPNEGRRICLVRFFSIVILFEPGLFLKSCSSIHRLAIQTPTPNPDGPSKTRFCNTSNEITTPPAKCKLDLQQVDLTRQTMGRWIPTNV